MIPVDVIVKEFAELGVVGSSVQLSRDVVWDSSNVSFASTGRSFMLVESVSFSVHKSSSCA